MIPLTGTVFLVLTASLFPTVRPDTGTGPVSDTVHFRQVLTDTVQDIQFTSDVATDRRIRLSVKVRSLDRPVVTSWMSTRTVGQWLHLMNHVSAAHELALTGDASGCGSDYAVALPEPSLVGHLFVLGSSVAVTPMNVRGVPIYKIDVMDADQDRTATVGVAPLEERRIATVLAFAVRAARILNDTELRRNGPMATHHSKRVSSSPGPAYPAHLRQAEIEGDVDACFVVDTTGRADMMTFRVIRSTDSGFTRAVRKALPRSRFTPASIEGHPFRERVIEPFRFSISRH